MSVHFHTETKMTPFECQDLKKIKLNEYCIVDVMLYCISASFHER